MENDDTKKGEPETPSDLLPRAPKTTATKKQGKAATAAKKSDKQKKWPLKEHWKRASRTKQIKWIAEGILVATAVLIPGIYIWDHLQTKRHFEVEGQQFSMEHRPRVIFSRPPQLFSQFTCEITDTKLTLRIGRMLVWLKNTKAGDAVGVYPSVMDFRAVPEKKTGFAIFDDIPPITEQTCNLRPPPKSEVFALNAGQELAVDSAQTVRDGSIIGANGKAVIPKDATLQLYFPICAYYFDEEGKRHGTCTTFRFNQNGRTPFTCSESPMTGTFEQTFSGYCEN